MKTCKCEHWQQCPVCMPHRFDAEGNVLPPEPTPLQAARLHVAKLEQQLADNQKQNALLRSALDYVIRDLKLRADLNDGVLEIGDGAFQQAEEALARVKESK